MKKETRFLVLKGGAIAGNIRVGPGHGDMDIVGDGCDVMDAVPLQVWGSLVFRYGCDRLGGAGVRSPGWGRGGVEGGLVKVKGSQLQ